MVVFLPFQFSKQTVIESYVSFIEHFPRAEKVLHDLAAKTTFQRFVEVSSPANSIIFVQISCIY